MEDGKLTVRAVERALDILLCFTGASELTLTEIATRVQLHKSTVHRLLASLEGKGFIMRDEATDKFRLGYRLWELSANLSKEGDPGIILKSTKFNRTITMIVRNARSSRRPR